MVTRRVDARRVAEWAIPEMGRGREHASMFEGIAGSAVTADSVA
jgi:hypothetical protein